MPVKRRRGIPSFNGGYPPCGTVKKSRCLEPVLSLHNACAHFSIAPSLYRKNQYNYEKANHHFKLALLAATPVPGQHFFSNVAIVSKPNSNAIAFTIPAEANTFNYRVEAGNDAGAFEIVSVIKPSGNSMLPKTYCYEISGMDYKYYRIGRIGMDGSSQYSEVVTPLPDAVPGNRPATPVITNTIAKGK